MHVQKNGTKTSSGHTANTEQVDPGAEGLTWDRVTALRGGLWGALVGNRLGRAQGGIGVLCTPHPCSAWLPSGSAFIFHYAKSRFLEESKLHKFLPLVHRSRPTQAEKQGRASWLLRQPLAGRAGWAGIPPTDTPQPALQS